MPVGQWTLIIHVPQADRWKASLDTDYLQLITPDGSTKSNVRIPKGQLGREIRDAQERGQNPLIIIQSVMGEEGVTGVRDGHI